MARGFLQSDEYRIRVVDSYYETYLGRDLDPGASLYWLTLQRSGLSEEAVLLNILASEEYLNVSQQ